MPRRQAVNAGPRAIGATGTVARSLSIWADQTVSDTIIIHVVDDDEMVRAAVADLVRSVGYAARGYASADAFLGQAPRDEPGCVIVDVRLPGLSGLDLQAAVAMPVIVMTGYGDVRMSVQAMKAGAIDFLEKPFRDQEMLDAIAAALDADRMQRAGGARLPTLQARHDTLTRRERQVMELACSGKQNKAIAAALGVSEVTVKVHRGAAMRKMGAKSIAELSRMATLLGLGGD
jgi:FixJ family two-component response regulator